MIQIEVKSFEQKINKSNSAESRKALDKEIQQYISFFQKNLIDYNISIDNYSIKDDLYLVAFVALRHKKATSQSEW